MGRIDSPIEKWDNYNQFMLRILISDGAKQ
jgi:hypothetical protein